MATERTRLGYRPELDGVRAVAILAVMLFHSLPYMPWVHLFGGSFGVDLFFVLSGFLITTLLIDEHDAAGTVDKKAFFGRRALRLLPALVVGVVLAGAIAAYLGSNIGGFPYPKAAVITLAYLSDLFKTDRGELGLLRHTWSLAIEAQYYLLWPFVMIGILARKIDRRYVALALFLIAVALSPLGSYVPKVHGFARSGLWAVTKSSGLLMGSALAIALSCSPRVRRIVRTTPLAVVAALIGTGVVVALAPKRPPQFWTLLVLLLSFALVIGHLVENSGSPLARVMRFEPLRLIGLISYGLYLYHFPINFLVHGYPTHRSGLASVGVAWVLTFAVAIASYRFIETPIRRLKRRKPLRPAAAGAET